MRMTHAPGWVEGAMIAALWVIVLIRLISAHWP